MTPALWRARSTACGDVRGDSFARRPQWQDRDRYGRRPGDQPYAGGDGLGPTQAFLDAQRELDRYKHVSFRLSSEGEAG